MATNPWGNALTEIEFMCVNSDFDNATPPHKQEALWEALKTVPGLHVYRQDFSDDKHMERSMAAIIRPEAPKHTRQTIHALAKRHGVGVDLEQPKEVRHVEGLKDDAVLLQMGEKVRLNPELTHFHTT